MKIIRKINIKKDYYLNNSLSNFLATKSLKNKISNESLDIDLLNAAIFYYTNQERIRMNLPDCEYHTVLQDSSIIHSVQMKTHDFISHENLFNPKYRTLDDRINSNKTENNQVFSCIGENIADFPILKTNGNKFIVKSFLNTNRYFSIDGMKEIHPYSYEEFAIKVVNGWMNSHGHRENILNPQFKFLGCGAVLYEKKNNALSFPISHFKITQNFGGDIIKDRLILPEEKKIRVFKKEKLL